MDTHLLHRLLLGGVYTQLRSIDRIIRQPGHPGLAFQTQINCHLRGVPTNWHLGPEGPSRAESQLLGIVMGYKAEDGTYRVYFHTENAEQEVLLLDSTAPTLRQALDTVVTRYNEGAYMDLIPANEASRVTRSNPDPEPASPSGPHGSGSEL